MQYHNALNNKVEKVRSLFERSGMNANKTVQMHNDAIKTDYISRCGTRITVFSYQVRRVIDASESNNRQQISNTQ